MLPVLRDEHGRFVKWLEPRGAIRERGKFLAWVEVPEPVKVEVRKAPRPRAIVEGSAALLPLPPRAPAPQPQEKLPAPPVEPSAAPPVFSKAQELARIAEVNRARELELARGRIEEARLQREIAAEEGFTVIEPITHEIRQTLDIDDMFDAPVIGQTDRGFDIPDPDFMDALADAIDIDISDLYDMYYGYPPGSHGR